MTREEAIQVLQRIKLNDIGIVVEPNWYKGMEQDAEKAINMAISALKDEPLSHEEAWEQIETHDSDLISREDAMQVLCSYCSETFCTCPDDGCFYGAEMAMLKVLPSVEAEDRLYIKIYADDEPSVMAEKIYQICGEQNRETAEWLKEYFPSAEKPVDGDLISRADAIKEIDKQYPFADYYVREQFEKIIKGINGLPSADRPIGEWNPMYDNTWMCSNCEKCEQFGENIESTSDFCPNCGAYMKGGKE